MPIPSHTAHFISTHMAQALVNKQAQDVLVMDLSGLSWSMADYFVMGTGTTDRQVLALADYVEEYVYKLCQEHPHQIEGTGQAEWVLMDYIHVIGHIFLPEARRRYDLEALWGDAKFKHLPPTSETTSVAHMGQHTEHTTHTGRGA